MAPRPVASSPPPGVRPPGRLQLLVGAVVLAVMGVSAAYSANVAHLRDRLPPPATRLDGAAQPPLTAAGGPAIPDGLAAGAAPGKQLRSRSQPWWQPVAAMSGSGPSTTEVVTIGEKALQWRLSWRCTAGSFTVSPVAQATGAVVRPLASSGACPQQGTGHSVQTGRFALAVTTPAAWEVTVEQQVDVPLVEPPLAAMSDPGAKVVATGTMYDIDRVGSGSVRLHQLPDGTAVLRLEDFFVSINSDLEIWLSEAERPASTADAAKAPHQSVVALKATTGSMNYPLPAGIDLSRGRSIVIWCELTRNAYAGASLIP